MLALILLLKILMVAPVHAQSEDSQHGAFVSEFCRSYIDAKEADVPVRKTSGLKTLGFILRYYFNRSSIVGIHSVGVGSPEGRQARPEDFDIYTVGSVLPSKVKEEFLARSEQFENKASQISAELKEIKTIESCEIQLKGRDVEFKEIKLEFLWLQNQPRTLEDLKNEKIEKYTLGKLSSAQSGLHVDVLKRRLSQQHAPVAALLLHATADGSLYDSYYHRIPRSVFEEISAEIQVLVIYSCHPEAVRQQYRLQKLADDKRMVVVTPELHPKVEWLFHESVPTGLFSQFLKKTQMSYRVVERPVLSRLNAEECWVQVDHSGADLGFWLNQHYLGMPAYSLGRLSFDCSILREKNTATLQNMNLFLEGDEPTGHSIKIEMNDRSLEVPHFYDADQKYIGSKLVF